MNSRKKYMRLILASIICMLCANIVYAQNTKGAKPAVSDAPKPAAKGKTYALIVGISKYKNPAIPQLQFANKDAIAFRNYLVSTGVDSNNITLLVDEQATNGEFWASLNFITDISKQGDMVYIYFSGHGDVESKTIIKDAYLLPYDAPKCVYPAGAIGIVYLKSWIATLSSNGIQPIFIADACRSGNLAGGREGMDATASVLKDKWQDEIKILSCQPGEFSLEGTQWGKGRGLFSFELMNGLAGLADRNKDKKVTLRELNLYLLDKVSESASPIPQNPMLFGNMEAVLANVDDGVLKNMNNTSSPTFAAVELKGFDDELIKNMSDSIKYHYKMFKTYVDSGLNIYFHPETEKLEKCAYYHYLQIPKTPETSLLLSIMKRNISATALKSIDQIISKQIDNASYKRGHALSLYYLSPNYVKAIKDLLDEQKIKQLGYASKLTFLELNGHFFDHAKDLVERLDAVITEDPSASYLYLNRAYANAELGKMKEAKSDACTAISLSPKYGYAYTTLCDVFLSLKEYDSAAFYFHMFHQMDPIFEFDGMFGLMKSHMLAGNSDSATHYLNKLYAYADSKKEQKTLLPVLSFLSEYHYENESYEKAIKHLNEKVGLLKPSEVNKDDYYNLACCYALINNKIMALKYMKLSVSQGWDDVDHIHADTDLDSIRNEKEFEDILSMCMRKRGKK